MAVPLAAGMNGNKGVRMKTSARHDDWLMTKLADADFAAEYLNAASEDDDPKSYLTALRKVVEARGGMAAPMATPNCSTYGHPNCPRQDG